ncbi:competence type IV pilus minor pilin ComGF [Streptococcus suis]
MREERWRVLRKTRCAAFTLLECLVALVIVSGSLLVFEGLSKLVVHEVRYQDQRVEKNWLLFCDQLRSEWEGASLDRVDAGRIYIRQDGQALAFGKSRSDDFRKTNDRGQGYQPMLYGVKAASYSQSGQIVRLDVTFETGEERSFVYDFEEKG